MAHKIIHTEDGSNTLQHEKWNETYHSCHGAMQESRHVFIQNGIVHFVNKPKISVFEVGFGTGLNTLLTLDYAENQHQIIDYQTIEAYPISIQEVRALNYDQIFNDECVKEWAVGFHQLEWNRDYPISSYFTFKKINGLLENFTLSDEIDCIYFDAFSPTTQPELWTIQILEKMYRALTNGGLLVTYCAKGEFKRNLKAVGFEVENVPGPPGKREMTIAWKRINPSPKEA